MDAGTRCCKLCFSLASWLGLCLEGPSGSLEGWRRKELFLSASRVLSVSVSCLLPIGVLFTSCECHPAGFFTSAVEVPFVAGAESVFSCFHACRIRLSIFLGEAQAQVESSLQQSLGCWEVSAWPSVQLRGRQVGLWEAWGIPGPTRCHRVLSERECHHGRRGSFFSEKNNGTSWTFIFNLSLLLVLKGKKLLLVDSAVFWVSIKSAVCFERLQSLMPTLPYCA